MKYAMIPPASVQAQQFMRNRLEALSEASRNFDINKYPGLWYEIKFHDWTQFKEVYDTTLDIKVRLRQSI